MLVCSYLTDSKLKKIERCSLKYLSKSLCFLDYIYKNTCTIFAHTIKNMYKALYANALYIARKF